MSRIFISYKREDKNKVFPLKEKIETATGEKCWIDLDGIESDAQFANVIIKAIDEAEIFLFMYSKRHSKIKDYEKDWTVREISYAQAEGKRIVFVNIDQTPLTKWFKFMFSSKQQVDATSEESFNHLLADINRWLSNQPTKIEIECRESARFLWHKRVQIFIKKATNKVRERRKQILLISIIGGLLTFFYCMRHTDFFDCIAHKSNTDYEFVDLGLPSHTLWAEYNIGAKSKNEYGNFYSWGEISPIEGNHAINTNIIQSASYQRTADISGTSYDVATIECGTDCALPTSEQFEELKSMCLWRWEKIRGTFGYVVKGPNGKEIFLPAAGCIMEGGYKYKDQFGYYWSGDCHPESNAYARELIIGIGLNEINIEYGKKNIGRSVRAVKRLRE